MSAASSASAPARRVAAPARPASAPAARATHAAVATFDDNEDEFRLNLSDIPRMRESMVVDGLRPSVLSRLLDLVAPIKP
jgi:hypothetical protein